MGNAKNFFALQTIIQEPKSPLTPLFQRGELIEYPLKVPL